MSSGMKTSGGRITCGAAAVDVAKGGCVLLESVPPPPSHSSPRPLLWPFLTWATPALNVLGDDNDDEWP